jgi:glutathione S-transferase
MKLYYRPARTCSRPVMLFASESSIPLEMQVVDLMVGEHNQSHFEAVNPNRLMPVLNDGIFRLAENSAVLKYLADKTGSARSPQDLQERARVNECMDWVNTQLWQGRAWYMSAQLPVSVTPASTARQRSETRRCTRTLSVCCVCQMLKPLKNRSKRCKKDTVCA